MKKLIFLLFALLPLTAIAQQESYTPYLEQALLAAKDNDAKGFNTNLHYFSVALDRDNITPATLTEKNRKLYTKALYEALAHAGFDVAEETAEKAVAFIRYDLDNPWNMFALGKFYYYGYGVEQNHAKAKYWYEKAAAAGDDMAMNNLGVMYHAGEGVEKNYAQARYWWEKSAELGDDVAVANLGVLYEWGQGVDQDYDKAISYYKKAAGMGAANGMNNMGAMYENGKGIVQDYSKAKDWYKKAAESGDADGMKNLGDLYYYDDKLTKDYTRAKYWYEKAAEKGNAGAMNILGSIYHNGYGLDKDYIKAKYWWEKAMKKGNTDAMVNLGWLYDYGHGVTFDWEKAFQWYKKAADLDNAAGLRLAGEFYLFGVGGVQKNKSKAMALFEKAKEKGDKKAATYLQVLRDIGNKKYYELSTSQYGNRIFVENEPLTAHQEKFPWVITKFGVGWQFDVDYQKTGTGNVQIFPTYINDKNRPDDDISFSNYAPSSPMSEERGSQGYRLSWKLERGYRAIGYTYITGHFPNNDNVNIKVPMALCWLPRIYYK